MTRTIIFQLGVPFGLCALSIALSRFGELTWTETTVIGVNSFLIGVLGDVFFSVLAQEKRLSQLRDDLTRERLRNQIDHAREKAYAVTVSLFLRMLNDRDEDHLAFFERAAEGVVVIRGKDWLRKYYGHFFEAANRGATIRATVLYPPNREWFELIKSAHQGFIRDKRGKVQRVFLLPRRTMDKDAVERARDMMEYQHEIGVEVFCADAAEVPPRLHKDIMILSSPRMANEATCCLLGDYVEAEFLVKRRRIQELEKLWSDLFSLYAKRCEGKDQIAEFLDGEE